MSEMMIQGLIWLGSFIFFLIRIEKRISKLEWLMDEMIHKTDALNNLSERMIKVEASVKSAHHRLDQAGIGKGVSDD